MIKTAVLTEDPRQVKGTDGVTRWRARALESLSAYPLDCHINLRAGEWYPFRKGDRVQVLLPYGTSQGAEIVGHKGLSGCEPQEVGNTEICSRLAADGESRGNLRLLAPGARCDLGEGDPGDQEQVAMHPKVSAELQALKGAIDAMGQWLVTAANSGGTLVGASGTILNAIEQGLGGESIVGGHPATNVYAKPDKG
jgi:hypothetical protein